MSEFRLFTQPSLSLRRQYLQALEEPQEWFLEELIALGQVWILEDGTYGILHDRTLVEFFSADLACSATLLSDFQRQLEFSTALVKSYDHVLVRSFEQLGWTAVVGGFLFRARKASNQTAFKGVQIRAATLADVQALWRIDDGFFDCEKDIANLLGTDKLWTVTVDGKIAGCTVSNRVFEDSDAVDVGMMVAPEFRRRGLGTYVVHALADDLESKGLRPVCGCGAGNIASRATLEKAGFVTEHQILRFTP